MLGPRQRRENNTFVVLTANKDQGQHRYVTGRRGALLCFESAEAALEWATDREPQDDFAGRLLVMQVPQRLVIDKAIAEDKTLTMVMESGERYTMRYTEEEG